MSQIAVELKWAFWDVTRLRGRKIESEYLTKERARGRTALKKWP